MMVERKMLFRGNKNIAWGSGIELNIAKKDEYGFHIATPMGFCLQPIGTVNNFGPALRLEPEDAQALMDELFSLGVRPSDGAGTAGQLASIKYHLEDMRKLVFNDS